MIKIVILLAIVGVVGYFVYKKFFKKADEAVVDPVVSDKKDDASSK
jgi:hypothetical protein